MAVGEQVGVRAAEDRGAQGGDQAQFVGGVGHGAGHAQQLVHLAAVVGERATLDRGTGSPARRSVSSSSPSPVRRATSTAMSLRLAGRLTHDPGSVACGSASSTRHCSSIARCTTPTMSAASARWACSARSWHRARGPPSSSASTPSSTTAGPGAVSVGRVAGRSAANGSYATVTGGGHGIPSSLCFLGLISGSAKRRDMTVLIQAATSARVRKLAVDCGEVRPRGVVGEFTEQFDLCLAEPVDRLLRIAHGEQAWRSGCAVARLGVGEETDDLVLNPVGVLELVDEHPLIAAAQVGAGHARGWRAAGG